ncbi:hypothetical protein AAY473_006794 [Plecturocebus cupreus]
MGFRYVAQAGFKLLASSDPPAMASQRVEITGMSHHAWHYSVSYSSVLTTTERFSTLLYPEVRKL